jgi:hypothetical protein
MAIFTMGRLFLASPISRVRSRLLKHRERQGGGCGSGSDAGIVGGEKVSDETDREAGAYLIVSQRE